MERRNQKSCHIVGAAHSGSTLVGMVLGSHDQCFYAGEARKTRYLDNERAPLRKRACKMCGLDCPVWGGFQIRGDWDLFEELSRRTGKPVIIDSTKNVDWVSARTDEVARASGMPCLVYLQRDGRAVINSRLRKYPDRDPAEVIETWASRIRGTNELFDDFAHPKLKLRYELFATQPEKETKKLCRLLGLAYQPSMLEYHRARHHPLGGNNGTQYLAARGKSSAMATPPERSRAYYESHRTGISLDLRWHEELSRGSLSLFERMASDVNAELKWEEDDHGRC